MASYNMATRQGWACGYELAPGAGIPVAAWSGLGYKGEPPTVCPGFTTTLPETVEAARAWRWWSKGQLADFVDGAQVSEELKLAIEIFDGAIGNFERWRMTPTSKGGGAE